MYARNCAAGTLARSWSPANSAAAPLITRRDTTSSMCFSLSTSAEKTPAAAKRSASHPDSSSLTRLGRHCALKTSSRWWGRTAGPRGVAAKCGSEAPSRSGVGRCVCEEAGGGARACRQLATTTPSLRT
eukprot:130205-Chlamydomonas_euryale.AAC.1